MWIVVFTMLFSGGLVPTFMVINKLHMMDTFWALVLPGAVPVFNVIILMNFSRLFRNPWRNPLMWTGPALGGAGENIPAPVQGAPGYHRAVCRG